ncbi:MAG TPA: hypothetical protein PK054_06825 [Anaerohalosphaeraceae bacterium]|nr:hypothetical protein [Anaerohalosphaeraceae bacterium]HOL89548.1 hypothetical protein [Anaerohalosphaeraceae bacterium]HPP56282.1 hypothetical protein [Anaerohalosphaeraceae bacterium]
MAGIIQTSGLQGWLDTIFGTVWTYFVLGLFFAAVLAAVLIRSLQPGILSRRKNAEKQGLLHKGLSPGQETQLFETLQKEPAVSKTVLLAAAGLDCLPVTVPIRLALLSCRSKNSCLLIDLDTKRDAVWKAFGKPSSNGSSPVPAESGLENLSLVPAHYFDQTRQMNLAPLLRQVKNQYKLILLNAPYLDGHPDRKMIAASADYAVLFAKEDSQLRRLMHLCESQGCKVLGCYKLLKSSAEDHFPNRDAAAASATQTVFERTGQRQ